MFASYENLLIFKHHKQAIAFLSGVVGVLPG